MFFWKLSIYKVWPVLFQVTMEAVWPGVGLLAHVFIINLYQIFGYLVLCFHRCLLVDLFVRRIT